MMILNTGDKFTTNEGCEIIVINPIHSQKVLIGFIDYDYQKYAQVGNIVRGTVKNPYFPKIYGIGFVGKGKYKANFKRKHTKICKTWNGMLERCYSDKYQENKPTYKGCSVHKDWYNFQVFAEWFEKNYPKNKDIKYHLDKDILVKGNKIYSSETCAFVPDKINSLFTKNDSKRGKYPVGVYKNANRFVASCNNDNNQLYLGIFETPELAFEAYKIYKENLIKTIAKEYFEKQLITKQVFDALNKYEVEITD